MDRSNDQSRRSDLGSRYGEIGISAVAAALRYKDGMKTEPVGQRRAVGLKGSTDRRDDQKGRRQGKQLQDAQLSREKNTPEDFNTPEVTER